MPDSAGSDVSIRLHDLRDVDRRTPNTGDALLFGGTHWGPGAVSSGSVSPWVFNTTSNAWVSYVGPVPADFVLRPKGPVHEFDYVTEDGQVTFYVSPTKFDDPVTVDVWGQEGTFQTYWWPGINANDVWQTNRPDPLDAPGHLYLVVTGPSNTSADPEPTVGSAAAIMVASANPSVKSIWIGGAEFVGNANGFGSPGGAGEYGAMVYPSGQNRFAIASIIVPPDWTYFEFDLYLSSTDANTAHRYLLEGNWGLFSLGDTLDGDLNAFVTDIQNAGAGVLAVGTGVQGIDNSGGATLFQLKIRSNNATNEIAGETHLLGALLHLLA